jgi:hypothetical protein
MRLNKSTSAIALTFALVALWPVFGQERPESILPPGFGDPEPAAPKKGPAERPDRPAPVDNDRPSPSDTPRSSNGNGSSAAGPSTKRKPAPRPKTDLGELGQVPAAKTDVKQDGEETVAPATVLVDIPDAARRPIDVVGVLGPTDGDMGVNAFQGINGQYLTKIMRNTRAPLVSRWGSIVLRRALLSRALTPTDTHGADWAAERAWMLLRMGEADAARMLVQSVDVDQYTPKMFDVAMQASLASADPAGLCAMTEWVDRPNKETEWTLARGMCSAMAGESALANAQLDRARDRKTPDIDVMVAEKVVGATRNTRRTVQIQWDEVSSITAWRFGLASATGVEVPANLLDSVGPHVRAWQARAPLLPYTKRLDSALVATSLGVFSQTAIVDFYGALYDTVDQTQRDTGPAGLLRTAFAGQDSTAKIAAMKTLWADDPKNPFKRYANMVATSRAASFIKPSETLSDSAPDLIESMLSAGLDNSAVAWANVATDDKSWGLLAVGGLTAPSDVSSSKINGFGSTSEMNADKKSQLLFAGLAGLGRISANEMNDLSKTYNVPMGLTNKWNQALDAAVQAKAPAAVAVLAAVGLQAKSWSEVPASHLYHIVSALRRVGLEGEARMIAVEAVTRI